MFPFVFMIVPLMFFLLIMRFGMRLIQEFFRDNRRHGRDFPQNQRSGGWFGDIGVFRLGGPANPESRIFRIANKLKGRMTISDLVLEANLGVKEAEELMNRMVDGTHVRMEVNDKGIIVYEFPEILARFEGGAEE